MESLRPQTEKFATVFQSVGDYLWNGEIDAAGRHFHRFYSPLVEQITGHPPEFYLAGPDRWLSIVHPEDKTRFLEASRRIVDRQATRDELEYRIVRPDGSIRWLCDSVRVIAMEGARVRVDGIVSDITERKDAEALLHARGQEFRGFVENSPDQIIRYDREYHRTYVNPAFSKTHDLPAEAFIGQGIGPSSPVLPSKLEANDVADVERRFRMVFETGEPSEYEIAWSIPGGRRNFAVRLFPEFDRSGVVTHIWAIARDITKLKETKRQLLALTENSPDLIARFDRDGRYLYVNHAVEKLTRTPAPDIVGKAIGEVMSERLGPVVAREFLALRGAVGQAFATGSPVETEFRVPRPTGERIFNVRLIPERDESGEVVSVLHIGREITEQKRSEQALRESEQRFRQVTETIDEVFWLRDLAMAEMIYISPAYERVWGRTCQSLYQSPHSWLDGIHPEDLGRVRSAAKALHSRSLEIDYRIVRPDGAVRWIHDRAFPIADADGNVYRICGVAEDITVKRQLEDQFRQAQKMEAVGQLAGGIAHDFNNILTAILLELDVLQQDKSLSARQRESIEELGQDSRRAAALVRQLLLFSRQQVAEKGSLDVTEVLRDFVEMLRRLLGEQVAVELQMPDALPRVEADARMIEQVVVNLCLNARDAMPHGGRLILALEAVQLFPEHVKLNAEARAGLFVRLTVADTGCGMDPASLRRIFEPFFTTKEPGKGTGLGLASAFGIVKQHQGWIEVQSAVGQGSTFLVYLPVDGREPPG